MVLCLNFFFAHIKRVHHTYKHFFESEDENREVPETTEEDTTTMGATESTTRFYFELTYQLAKEDLTKFDRILETNMYLCLSTASLMKDRIIKQQNEMKKLESKMKKQ